MVDANEFYDELKKVDSRDRIFSVSFYGENFRESLYSTMNLKKAAIYYSENYDKVDHFTIDFLSNQYGGCNFVILDNLDKLISYNNENNKYKKSNKINEGIKQVIRINENQLRGIISESVKVVLNEIGYNPFSDDDFGGSGDPYGLVDSDMEEANDSLDGYYDTFNNISVRIVNDGKPNVAIAVSAKGNGNGNGRVVFRGVEAQEILDKIKSGAEEYGNINISMYRNLYKYVL